jgi:transposase InsO family protein
VNVSLAASYIALRALKARSFRLTVPCSQGLTHARPWGCGRIRRLTKKLGLWAVGPKPNTSKPHPEHKIYPYLLRGLLIERPNKVWATDITYIRPRQGFLYLCASWIGQRARCWPGACRTR